MQHHNSNRHCPHTFTRPFMLAFVFKSIHNDSNKKKEKKKERKKKKKEKEK